MFGPFYMDKFVKFNMFNFLFNNKSIINKITKNLNPTKPILIIADPPFGGLVQVFIDSFKYFTKVLFPDFKFELAWIFPYFHETEIKNSLPSINLLNYCVDYKNHPRFQANLYGHKSSIVRIFTTIDVKTIKIIDPLNKFCGSCKCYQFIGSNHCNYCQTCFGHEKLNYRHCFNCSKCVKEKWVHCLDCKKCVPSYHNCNSKVKKLKSGKRSLIKIDSKNVKKVKKNRK